MSSLISSENLAAACQLLRQASANSAASLALQQALQRVVQASDLQILGICAESLAEGQQALAAYAAALGLPQPDLEVANLAGAVYIKFNPQGRSYASPYSGSERGVLVSCQSAEPSDVNEMFGALPLSLFSSSTQIR